mmetsp:Transcript_4414/g.14660  ORF Transcript_4414/g.14660 Transcript_4414/m.14660 type:complete len:268 (+) Transcript_4414:772-1575(+)
MEAAARARRREVAATVESRVASASAAADPEEGGHLCRRAAQRAVAMLEARLAVGEGAARKFARAPCWRGAATAREAPAVASARSHCSRSPVAADGASCAAERRGVGAARPPPQSAPAEPAIPAVGSNHEPACPPECKSASREPLEDTRGCSGAKSGRSGIRPCRARTPCAPRCRGRRGNGTGSRRSQTRPSPRTASERRSRRAPWRGRSGAGRSSCTRRLLSGPSSRTIGRAGSAGAAGPRQHTCRMPACRPGESAVLRRPVASMPF